MVKSVLKLEKITKSFGELTILKDIDFEINEGQLIAVIGPSGVGKSTFLHVAGLMEKPTAGKIILNEIDVTNANDNDRSSIRLNDIGFLFQFHYLLPDFNAIENVLLPLRISGHFNENSDNEAKELLSQLGLSERFGHHPQELSGGEQQRVSLARALIRKPKLLLCDEPTGNLDQKTAQGVANLIFEQTRQLKTSVVLVTHNQDLAHKTDKIFQLQDGRFIG